jgi:hypothetical protein
MTKRLLAAIVLAALLPLNAYCRDKSDTETYKNFVSSVIDTIMQQPNKTRQQKINVTEVKYRTSQKPAAATKQAGFVPEKYDFSHTTPYGSFKVIVITTSEKSFTISFISKNPIQQYQLVDSTTKAISLKDNLNDETNYTFTVARAFEPKYVLILSMLNDGVITQNIIPLYKKANVKFAQ